MEFQNKLKKRMTEKNITPKELAKRIHNYGADSDLWEGLDYEQQRNKVRKVQKWMAGSAKPNIIDDLEVICNILDCDFSYLLDGSPIANLNNKKVAEWLGLDENVVSNIKNYDREIKLFISLLVRANEYDNTLGDILLEFIKIMLLHSNNSYHTTITIKNDLTGRNEELKGESVTDYIMSATKNMMESIFYKVSILGVKIGSIRANIKHEEEIRKRKEETEQITNNIMEITGKSREEVIKEFEAQRRK